jgi:hypothetical protein
MSFTFQDNFNLFQASLTFSKCGIFGRRFNYVSFVIAYIIAAILAPLRDTF